MVPAAKLVKTILIKLTIALLIGALAAVATYRVTMQASMHRSVPSVPHSPGSLF